MSHNDFIFDFTDLTLCEQTQKEPFIIKKVSKKSHWI